MTINQATIDTASTGTTIVPAPATGSYANVGIFFCNYNTVPVTLQVYLQTAAGSPTDANSIMRDLTLQPKETFVLNVEKFLLSGTNTRVSAIASVASSVVATASYIAI